VSRSGFMFRLRSQRLKRLRYVRLRYANLGEQVCQVIKTVGGADVERSDAVLLAAEADREIEAAPLITTGLRPLVTDDMDNIPRGTLWLLGFVVHGRANDYSRLASGASKCLSQ